jgi:hypothetical protein
MLGLFLHFLPHPSNFITCCAVFQYSEHNMLLSAVPYFVWSYRIEHLMQLCNRTECSPAILYVINYEHVGSVYRLLFCCPRWLMSSLHSSVEGQCINLNWYCNVDVCIGNVREGWGRTLIAKGLPFSVGCEGVYMNSIPQTPFEIHLYALVVYKTEVSVNVYFDPAASFSQLGAMIVIPQITLALFLLNSRLLCDCTEEPNSPVSCFTHLHFYNKTLLLLWLGSVLICKFKLTSALQSCEGEWTVPKSRE